MIAGLIYFLIFALVFIVILYVVRLLIAQLGLPPAVQTIALLIVGLIGLLVLLGALAHTGLLPGVL